MRSEDTKNAMGKWGGASDMRAGTRSRGLLKIKPLEHQRSRSSEKGAGPREEGNSEAEVGPATLVVGASLEEASERRQGLKKQGILVNRRVGPSSVGRCLVSGRCSLRKGG